MQIIVTVKSFEEKAAEFNFLIPAMKETMESVVNRLITLEEPPINIGNLVAIHFTENYREELFAFQESIGHPTFATQTKIGDGYAQVVYVAEGQGSPDLRGYHIFISKFIPMAIMVGQYGENLIGMLDTSEAELLEFAKKSQREKNKYLRMIRHELAHVEDGNNQNGWTWLESAFQGNTVKSMLRYDAFRLWEEYYACRRSNFFYDVNATTEEVTSLLSNLEEAEAEICDLRWKYNNGEITLDEFVQLLHEYIRLAFIYCCYFMGHTDGIYEYVVDKLQPELYPSRFYRRVGQMWGVLRAMADSYPNWDSPEVFDDLSTIILNCIVEFEIYPRDTDQGAYYDIPPRKLVTKSQELA